MATSYVLETARLRLREITWDDFEEVHAMNTDPRIMQYMGGIRTNRETLRAWLQKNFFEYYRSQPGLGVWAAILKENGAFLGWFGLKHQGFNPTHEIEIGYRVKPNYWRQGFGVEGAKGVLNYGFAQLGLPQISAAAEPKNFGSCRVLEKAGMQFYGYRQLYNGWLIYYLLKKEWQERETNTGHVQPVHP